MITMTNTIYIYEYDPEVSKYISDMIHMEIDEDIKLLVDTSALASSVDIVLDKPNLIIASYQLNGINGVQAYAKFCRYDIPIIYYDRDIATILEQFTEVYGSVPENVYCINRQDSISHMIKLIQSLVIT
jgi:hypothetical protein